MGMCLASVCMCIVPWRCTCVCLHGYVGAHRSSLLVRCQCQGACQSPGTHGSLLLITLRLLWNSSELILIDLEATTLRHEAVKCECLQMSVQGWQTSRRTDQGLGTEKYMPVHPCSRAPSHTIRGTHCDSKSITSWRAFISEISLINYASACLATVLCSSINLMLFAWSRIITGSRKSNLTFQIRL